jgi:hypothetical protein
MHAARAGDVAGAIHHHVTAMLLDVGRDAFNWRGNDVVGLGDPLHQFFDCSAILLCCLPWLFLCCCLALQNGLHKGSVHRSDAADYRQAAPNKWNYIFYFYLS